MEKLTSRAILSLLILVCLTLSVLFSVERIHANTDWLGKQEAVKVIGLPDQALGFESTWLRHRSLATLSAIFPEGPGLMAYYPAEFTYSVYIGETP